MPHCFNSCFRIKDIPDSPGSSFNYSFNPCIPFTEGTCENVAGCQIDTTTKVGFDIGAAAQVNFSLDSVTNHLVGTYKSGDHKRSSVVQYICDPRIDPPQASVQGEIEPLTYHFSIKSTYACASSVPVTAKCIQIDQCSCRFDDGRGTVDLTTIAKHGVPLIMDAQAGPYYYSFNPCFSFNEGTCLDVAGCQYENISGIYIDIAAAFPMTLSYDGTNIVGNYASSDGARKTIVTYVCDPTVNTTIAIANGELWFAKYSFTIISKDICPKNTTGSSSHVRIKEPFPGIY